MKNLTYAMFILVLCGAATVGCGNKQAETDMATYAGEDLPPLRDILNGAIQKYESVSGGNYTEEAVLYETMRLEVLPLLKDLLLQADALHPESEKISRLHDAFLAAARRYASAFQLYLLALDQQNMQNVAVALEELEEAQSLRREFDLRYENACIEFGILPEQQAVEK